MGLRHRKLLLNKRCFFVTTTCNDWLQLIAAANGYSIITDSINFLCLKYNAIIFGYVIMPNHIHMILYFSAETKLSEYMRDFKKFTAVNLRQEIELSGDMALLNSLRHEHRDQKFKVWMDRFDDVFLVSKDVLETKLEYIHNNPLQERWRLAVSPELYPFSSAAFYVKGQQGSINVTHYIDYFQ